MLGQQNRSCLRRCNQRCGFGPRADKRWRRAKCATLSNICQRDRSDREDRVLEAVGLSGRRATAPADLQSAYLSVKSGFFGTRFAGRFLTWEVTSARLFSRSPKARPRHGRAWRRSGTISSRTRPRQWSPPSREPGLASCRRRLRT
jgi:hypothetical protein